jgi:hypothetical protein
LEQEQKENNILRPKYSSCTPYCAVLDVIIYKNCTVWNKGRVISS